MFRFFAILAIFVFAVFAAACGKTVEVLPTESPTASESPVATSDPTVAPTSEPTVTPPSTPGPTAPPTLVPTVPPTLVKPTPGSCLVLPEEYCRSGSTVSWPNKPPQLDLSPILGCVLPEGTPIFAPFDGELRITGKSPINPQAPAMSLKNAAGQDSFLAFGDISYAVQPESGSFSVPVRKGEVLATVASSGILTAGKYNVVMYFANSQVFPVLFPK